MEKEDDIAMIAFKDLLPYKKPSTPALEITKQLKSQLKMLVKSKILNHKNTSVAAEKYSWTLS